ncbi:MAG: helix-turn-helix domain-containing protein [Bdellovibrionales bacterium]|nr:helix-turn-helix domain-containing protein [Bdellovibrionales bacterium]
MNKSKNKRLDKVPKKYREAVKTDLVLIAEKIKKQRRAKGMTQEQFSEIINVEPTTLQAIEQQRGRPSLELLLTIVKVLETKIVIK